MEPHNGRVLGETVRVVDIDDSMILFGCRVPRVVFVSAFVVVWRTRMTKLKRKTMEHWIVLLPMMMPLLYW